jgi:hypothetical protein
VTNSGQPVFPDAVVAEVIRRRAQGELIIDLAAELGVHVNTVSSWVRRVRRSDGQKRYRYLKDKDVRTIRVRAAQGHPLARLAREFGLSLTSVNKLVAGRRRREAGGPLRDEWSQETIRSRRRMDGWSAAEDEMAMTLPAKAVAKQTGRTEGAVRARRSKIRSMHPESDRWPLAYRPWSASEDALLGLPGKEVAKRTGRTLRSVYSRRTWLGLTRKRPSAR